MRITTASHPNLKMGVNDRSMLALKETHVSLDVFYTFPVLEADEQRRVLVRWCVNVRLKRHIEGLVQQNPQVNEATLARYFMDAVQQSSPPVEIARSHLVAFLASFSYRSAARIKAELEQLNYVSSDISGFVQDLFQTAFEIALDPLEFFKNFEVERSQERFWYFSLKGYIRRKLEGLLRDQVRTMEGLTTYGRTDLGLAARSSEKRVISALRALGEPESKVMAFGLAWKCFQEARTAKVIQVDSPQPEQFQAIAQRYNHLKSKSSAPAHPDIDGPTLEQWLKSIGAAIRRYCDRPVESLDVLAYKMGGETTQGDLVADERTIADINTLSRQEIQTDLGVLKELIETALQQSDSELKRILLFKYGLNLTQMQIGVALQKHQSSVSRTHRNFEEGLIRQFAKTFNPQAPGIDHDTLLALRDYFNEYWQNYYAELMHYLFQESYRVLQGWVEKVPSHYTRPLNPPILGDFENQTLPTLVGLGANAEINETSQTASKQQLEKFHSSFLEHIILRVQDYGQFIIEPGSIVQQKLSALVGQWLQTTSFSV